MLEQWTLEETLFEMGVTPEEVIDILVAQGYELPEYIVDREFEYDNGLSNELPAKEPGA